MDGFFKGYYFKHQKGDTTLCIIAGASEEKSFIQIITEKASYFKDFKPSEIQMGKEIRLPGCRMSDKGISIDLRCDGFCLVGKIKYIAPTPLKSDIMGFFKNLKTECRHTVISMHHLLMGSVILCGETINFDGGVGYIEGDSGTSFPKEYLWLHCNSFPEKLSVMLSVAKLKVFKIPITGCICAVWYKGKEYRLATYKGVRVISAKPDEIVLKQGSLNLTAEICHSGGQLLSAPEKGKMSRSIRETASCPASFCLKEGEREIFRFKSSAASFEYVK